RYWKEFGTTEQYAAEVAEASRLDPEDPEVILAAADLARVRADALAERNEKAASRAEINAAAAMLRQGIDRHLPKLKMAADSPLSERDTKRKLEARLAGMFLALSLIEERLDAESEAQATIRRGIEALPEHGELRLQLADLHIRHARLDEAEAEIDRLREMTFA